MDLICNYVGLEEMANNMTWNGHKGFTVLISNKGSAKTMAN
jgi:hypothetical protein